MWADIKSLLQAGVNAANAKFAQTSVLRRYNSSTFKARYREPRSGDGTQFVDDYVKLARGSLRLHFCGSKREYWILRRALFKYSKHLTPVTR